MEEEKVKKENLNKLKKEKKSKQPFNLKKYLREFLIFIDKKLLKISKILLIVAILIIAICFKFAVTLVMSDECEGTCMDGISMWLNYSENIQVLGITAISGIVPYIYAPIVGYLGSILSELSRLAYLVKGYGYIAGIGLGIVPLILNIFVICIITALGIYVCKTVTIGYRISSINNMNFTNFRIRLYEVLRKEDKIKKLKDKKQKKISKLEKSKEKLNYLQIVNVLVLACVLQFISVLIQHILM